ncbi:MAG: fibronectin type III domain-containing protein [Treponema sp.]|nr:fibronectin type III domain-containing protein [Treponema sp.]
MGILKKILSQKVAFLLLSLPLFASPKTMILGGDNGWGEISQLQGLTIGTQNGQFGYDAVELSTKTVSADSDTDLLLTFDEDGFYDAVGNYTVLSNNLIPTADSVKGEGAALSRGHKNGIILSGNEKALFGKVGFAGSFSIEFWLCPSLAENGEVVLSWRSSLNDETHSEYQMISASFYNNHLEWTFNNIFVPYPAHELHLHGFSTVVPNKWARHTISFNQETGLLEYLVDGRTEALMFVTEGGHEKGTVYDPILGEKAAINLCPDYVGKIDNFRISRTSASRSHSDIFATGNEKYKITGGRFVTKPLLISQAAVVTEIDTLMNVPSQTDIRFYIRSGDNCYGWNDNYPQWKEIVPGEQIEGVKGLYFQLSAELLPDGAGTQTPRLSEITVKYNEQNEPLPPFAITARAGDGSVTLSWSHSVDDNAGGYYVYYGNRPGEYLGRMAVQGSSPVNVGNVTSATLTGLENGRIYYFAVSAYSKVDGRINGLLSKEVFARPSSRLSKK